ncbi:unnamed protein product [Discula destructiva]
MHHGALHTATAAALVQADSTRYLASNFTQIAPSAHQDLEPVVAELCDLQQQLQLIHGGEIPAPLQTPLADVIDGCAGICRRIGDILDGCGDDTSPETWWALVGASTEVQQLQLVLGHGRRTIQVVVGAMDPDENPGIVEDLERLQSDAIAGTSILHAPIVDCLNAVESHVCISTASMQSSGQPRPVSTTIQDMISAFRRSSSFGSEAGEPMFSAAHEQDDHADSTITLHFSDWPLHLNDIDEGDILSKLPPLDDSTTHKRKSLRPPPLRLQQRSLIQESISPHSLSSFPPASPPPVKALPPIPPKSERRLPVSPAWRKSAEIPSQTAPPAIPIKSRARAFSDQPYQSGFLTPSSARDRFSGSSKGSLAPPPPRPSSYTYPAPLPSPLPDMSTDIEILPLRRLEGDEGHSSSHSYGAAYSIETPSRSTVMASRHGKFHIKVWDLSSAECLATIKVPFYVQVQPRSREYFIRSHSILSETRDLIGISTSFGHTLEIWNWAKRKKLQTIDKAMRWTAVRTDVYESRCPPLATYSEEHNAIKLHSVSSTTTKPFAKARVIDLKKAGLPHLPKLPELAFSATGPLLLAAAGPRPPRPGNPPPVHSGLLMAWQLDGDARIHKPYKFLHTDEHPEIYNSLPLTLATYGSVAVSIWEAAKFRTIGRPGLWQVEPVPITERVVLVWDFSGAVDRTSTYRIPAVLACVSPDCRFVAYCDPGGRHGSPDDTHGGALVVLDATRGGRELWRLEGLVKKGDAADEAGVAYVRTKPSKSSHHHQNHHHHLHRWSFRSSSSGTGKSEQRSSGRSSGRLSSAQVSDGSSVLSGGTGLEALAADLQRVTELVFSGDGSQLFVGDCDGGIGVYEFRVDGLHATASRD